MTNNFILTFGRKPYNYINRSSDFNSIIESFTSDQPTEQLYLITGVRGSGKTVLLSSLSSFFESLPNWIVVDLNPNNDLSEELVAKLFNNKKLNNLFIKKELSLSFHGLSFSIEGETPVLTAESWMEKIFERLMASDKKILITIDEATSTASMKSFVHMFQSFIRKNYPAFMLMTGLYENISEIQNSKSLTFLYRAPKIYLTSLSIIQITQSYKKIFNLSYEKASELGKLTCGYAFAYQLLGYLLQNNSKNFVDDIIMDEYDNNLNQLVYEKIWSELTSVEKELLKIIAQYKEISIKELITKSNKSSSFISLYRDRLIKKGIVYSPSYGYLSLSLPRFANFIEISSYI